jgi:hypothetical protein
MYEDCRKCREVGGRTQDQTFIATHFPYQILTMSPLTRRQCQTRGWRNVDPVYRVGGGVPPEALNFFGTFSYKIIQTVCNTSRAPLELDLVSCTHIHQ